MSVVLHLAAPESPGDFNVTYLSYSTITVKWQAGFDGGWKQVFRVTLDESLSKETNQTQFTFTSKSSPSQQQQQFIVIRRSSTFTRL